MSWQVYRLIFQIKSPLHIGWRKVSNLMQTRYYIPGRMFWGALTQSLTHWMGETDYRKTGLLVQENLCFSYFFPAEDPDLPLYPMHKPKGSYYGNYSSIDFEKKFISITASTAIANENNAAEEGSLHEIEYLKPSLNLGEPVFLVGHLFVQKKEEIMTEDNDVKIGDFSLFHQIIASLRIGGERRSGFGCLELCIKNCQPVGDIFGYTFIEENQQCIVTVQKDSPLLAHALINGLSLKGTIEPLVSREWSNKGGPGRQLSLLGLCYIPGTLVNEKMSFILKEYGIWQKYNK